jgi:hypothetical protein
VIAIPSRRRACSGLVVCAVLAALAVGAQAEASETGDRAELRVAGTCGRASAATLRLRAEDGRIRADLRVRTPRTGIWRVAAFHERRLVARARVRATRRMRGFHHRLVVPDYAGPDAIRMRAVAPGGETCSAGATLVGS